MVNRLVGLEVQEVSIVDNPAVPKAKILVTKRATPEVPTEDMKHETDGILVALGKRLMGISEPAEVAKSDEPEAEAATPEPEASVETETESEESEAAAEDAAPAAGEDSETEKSVEAAVEETVDGEAETTKAMSFDEMRAADELNDELPDAFSTLQDAIWNAMYGYGADGTPLTPAEKQTLVERDLDEFKAFAVGLLASNTAAKSADKLATCDACGGLRKAASVEAEVEKAAPADVAKAAEPEAPVMDPAAIAKAFSDQFEQIVKAAMESNVGPLAEQITALSARVETVETRKGVRQGLDGQEGGVAKRSAGSFESVIFG